MRRAAELQGRSVSDFVVTATQEAAQRAIEDVHVMRMAIEDQRAIVDALLDPPAPNDALRRAMAAHQRLVLPN